MECMDISEFEENFDEILATWTAAIAVTRNGQLLGHYIPLRHLKTGPRSVSFAEPGTPGDEPPKELD